MSDKGWVVTMTAEDGKVLEAEVLTPSPQSALAKVGARLGSVLDATLPTLSSFARITLERTEFPQVKLVERIDLDSYDIDPEGNKVGEESVARVIEGLGEKP